jgi:hypothetical protein
MRFVGSTGFDPAFQGLDVFGWHGSHVGIRRRHDHVGIFGEDATDDFAFLRIAGNDGGDSITNGHGFFSDIETEVATTVLGILAVTEKAIFREDGTDIPIETRDFIRRCENH